MPPSKMDVHEVPRHLSPPSEGRFYLSHPSLCRFGRSPDIEREIDADWTAEIKNTVFAEVPAQQRPTIFRIPKCLLVQDKSSYKPQIISIGPSYVVLDWFHISESLARYKLRCVSFLLSRHRCEDKASELLTRCLFRLKELSSKIRSCYSHEINMHTRSLAELMLYDGCFIIRYLLKQTERGDAEDKNEEQMLRLPWIWKLVDRDLLKLENQIPFFVIETLFELLRTEDDEGILLVDLALKLFSKFSPMNSYSFKPRGDYFHLLHLIYCSFLPPEPESDTKIAKGIQTGYHDPIKQEWLPSLNDLYERAWVTFRQKRTRNSFLDVTFRGASAECGSSYSQQRSALDIPSLHLTSCSVSLLRNLVAFELLYPDTRKHMIAYSMFMHRLLSKDIDVAKLRSCQILVGGLSSDIEVINLFKELANAVPFDSDDSYLRDIFLELNKR